MSTTISECAGCDAPVAATVRLSFNPSGRAYVCRKCRHWHLGFPGKPESCSSCGGKELYEQDLKRAMCPECTKKLEQADEVVKAGGVYWSCSGCCSEGILKPDHPLARKLRATYHVPPPDPIVLNLNTCPYCEESSKRKEESPARVDTVAS
jgi:anaerobic ribonucleoside-triphosphate reductase